MQLYLTRRNLNGIAGIDLAGVTPLVEKTVALGDGADYDDKSKSIDLPLAKEGAYLTMIRGDNLYASGIVLVIAAGDGGARRGSPRRSADATAVRSRSHHRSRRSHQGIPPQGAGQGDRHCARLSSSRAKRTCGACSSPKDCAGWSPRLPAREPRSMRFTAVTHILGRPSARADRQPRTWRSEPSGSASSRAVTRRQSQDAEHRQFLQADRAACSSDTLSPADKSKGAAAGGFR